LFACLAPLLALTRAQILYYYISDRMSGLCLGLLACLAPLLALTGAPILYYDKVFHMMFIITCVIVIAMDAVDKKVNSIIRYRSNYIVVNKESKNDKA
jgi:hypothetical protein